MGRMDHAFSFVKRSDIYRITHTPWRIRQHLTQYTVANTIMISSFTFYRPGPYTNIDLHGSLQT